MTSRLGVSGYLENEGEDWARAFCLLHPSLPAPGLFHVTFFHFTGIKPMSLTLGVTFQLFRNNISSYITLKPFQNK